MAAGCISTIEFKSPDDAHLRPLLIGRSPNPNTDALPLSPYVVSCVKTLSVPVSAKAAEEDDNIIFSAVSSAGPKCLACLIYPLRFEFGQHQPSTRSPR